MVRLIKIGSENIFYASFAKKQTKFVVLAADFAYELKKKSIELYVKILRRNIQQEIIMDHSRVTRETFQMN